MIQLNEVRIGNWFIGYDSKPFKWDLIHFESLSKGVCDIDELIKSTLELTPKVLEKCGLEFNGTYWDDDNIKIATFPTTNETHKLFITHNSKACYIETLHQLQNIYYDLFQEELKINL